MTSVIFRDLTMAESDELAARLLSGMRQIEVNHLMRNPSDGRVYSAMWSEFAGIRGDATDHGLALWRGVSI